MIFQKFIGSFKRLSYTKLEPALEKKFRRRQRESFVSFLRSALLFGVLAYLLLFAWDYFFGGEMIKAVIYARAGMIGIFILTLICSYAPKFDRVGQYVGMVLMMVLMANVIWTQSIIETNLEEGYGMLVIPGSEMSMIVFSGAEMGYGALLTPLLLLPIAFTAPQTLIVSLLTIAAVNIGMSQSDLPAAFVETSNSIFISIGLFSTILSFLVNQQRRHAFSLSEDLKDALDRAEESSLAKSNFLSTMSHEVRTPLHGILGMAGLLRDTKLNQKQKGYLSNVKDSGETLLNMLNDILDFSKMEAGKFEIEKQAVNFNQLLKSVVELMHFRAEEKGIELKLETDENLPEFVHTDPTRLRQVLLNLLSNAIKFTDEGSVTLRVTGSGGKKGRTIKTKFEVIDTGIGISEKNQQNLFQEFSQVENTVSKGYGGTGLGLSICFKLVELFEGRIQVVSAEGEGSNFWFEIPLEVTETQAGASKEGDDKKDTVISSLSILVVDDEAINRQIANDFLIKDNHKVTCAESGEEALSIIKAGQRFDLIFMDMRMPGIDGLEATRAIQSLEDHSSQLVIGMTANNSQDDYDRCISVGMADVLTKPYNLQKLRQILTNNCSGKKVSVKAPPSAPTDKAEPEREFDDLLDYDVFDDWEETFGKEETAEFFRKSIISIEQHLEELSAVLDDDDAEEFIEVAHKLRGVSGFCGMKALHQLAADMEDLTKTGSYEEAKEKSNNVRNIYQMSFEALAKIYPVD